MKKERIYNYLDIYLDNLLAEGKISFSFNQLKNSFPEFSMNALQMNLKRLNKKKKIRHIMKGFYSIIQPEYRSRKIIPPELFVDQLFAYLQRSYYVGLLSAASMHGASHQQAMEYYVFIEKPAIRSTNVEGLKINYMVKNSLPQLGVEKRKTDAGYINISNPELTAVDLIAYQYRIGGLNRASTVLYELSESISPSKLSETLKLNIQLSVLQRLGFILDNVLKKKELASVIKDYLSDKKIFRIPLKPGNKKFGFEVNEDWKVIQNFKIETDFV
jgi:predicted transcriptional regulator of viral defense system